MPSQRTITISQEHNISQALWDTITSVDRLNIVIEDIRADKDVSIEIKLFFSLYSVYTELENKRREIEKKLAVIHDDVRRQPLIEEREKDVQEEKQIRINILLTARSFNGMKYSPLIQEVADLFFLGDTQSAFNKLKPNELKSDQDHILALIENGIALENTRDKLEDSANEFKVKAQLSTLNFDVENPDDRFKKSLFYFESGKKSATFTRRNHFYSGYIFDYAYFLQKHNQFIQAQPLYEEALQIRRQQAQQDPQTFLPHVAGTLNNLAMLFYALNEFGQAEPLYEETLQISRQQARQNPNAYLPDVAGTLNNLAMLFYRGKKFGQAEPLYKEALQIRWLLAQLSPQTYLPHVAGTLNNLAVLYNERNEFSQAAPFYEEALRVYRQLAQEAPKAYLPDVATTLNNLAFLYNERNEFDKAQPLYEEALQIRRQLAQQNPKTFLPDVADVLNNLAKLYKARNEIDQALPLYEEALQIKRQLAKQNPQTFLPSMALTQNNLAILYSDRNRFSQAQPMFEEVLQIRRQLAQQNPQTFLPDVEQTLNNLAILYHRRNEFGQAQTLYEEALQIGRQLAQQNPQTFLPDVAKTLYNLSIFYKDSIKDKFKSLAYAQEALDILKPYERSLGMAQRICEGARSVITYWQFNRLSYPNSAIGESYTPQKKATENEFKLDNARKLLDNIRKKISEGSSERALTDAESFILSFEKIEEEKKVGAYECLAEAKMLLGMCYGKRAGNIISVPEDRYLSEAYELSKNLLASGTVVVDLYIECAFRKIESLKKHLTGWFPSKKAKRQVALLREEVTELTKGKAISKESLAFYEEIKNIR